MGNNNSLFLILTHLAGSIWKKSIIVAGIASATITIHYTSLQPGTKDNA